jgi:hypothetical protein
MHNVTLNTGLVVKPVVGISDAATDLFQGVKGTTDDIASFGGIASSSSTTDNNSSSRNSNNSTVVDKLQALVLGVGSSSGGQVRPRRTLYGPQRARVLRPYVLADAQAAALLIEKGTQRSLHEELHLITVVLCSHSRSSSTLCEQSLHYQSTAKLVAALQQVMTSE